MQTEVEKVENELQKTKKETEEKIKQMMQKRNDEVLSEKSKSDMGRKQTKLEMD